VLDAFEYLGHRDTALSEKGVRQAQLLSERLQHERFTHVFTSDLQRAKQVRCLCRTGKTMDTAKEVHYLCRTGKTMDSGSQRAKQVCCLCCNGTQIWGGLNFSQIFGHFSDKLQRAIARVIKTLYDWVFDIILSCYSAMRAQNLGQI